MVDDRLRNIREGAGKEDSRYSELMTDLLQKAGPYVMGAVIVCSGGYLAYKWYDTKRTQALSAAFFELEQAIDSGSPSSLEAVARSHAGQRSVTRLAEAELGEIYLAAARRGVVPGATLKADGGPERPEDVLTPEKSSEYLSKASAAFQSTLDATKDDPQVSLLALKALFGLAGVAESKGDVEGAGRYYSDAATRAKAAGYDAVAQLATKRKETAGGLSAIPPLFTMADLPARMEAASPFPTMPGATGSAPMNITTPGGGPGPVMIPSGPPPGFGADGKPLPKEDGTVGPPLPAGTPTTPPTTPPAAPAPAPQGEQPKATPRAPAPTTPPAPPSEPKQDPKR